MVTSTTNGLCLILLCSGKRTLRQQRPQKERNTKTKFEIEHPLNLTNYENFGEITQKDPNEKTIHKQQNETKEACELLITNENKILCSKTLRATKATVKIVPWNGFKIIIQFHIN